MLGLLVIALAVPALGAGPDDARAHPPRHPPTPAPNVLPGVAPTLLVSFDGFRASYVDAQPRDALPNLHAFWTSGVRAALVPRFVSKTFPNHYSLVTGLAEEAHGVIGVDSCVPERREWSRESHSSGASARRANELTDLRALCVVSNAHDPG